MRRRNTVFTRANHNTYERTTTDATGAFCAWMTQGIAAATMGRKNWLFAGVRTACACYLFVFARF
eukprot:7203866-Lingulodinium_polyedra.AAC.1